MTIITKVKTKGQITLPAAMREKLGFRVGDYLKITLENGSVTLTPQTLVDSRIAESIADYKTGKSHGPFNSANELVASLKKNIKQRAKKK